MSAQSPRFKPGDKARVRRDVERTFLVPGDILEILSVDIDLRSISPLHLPHGRVYMALQFIDDEDYVVFAHEDDLEPVS